MRTSIFFDQYASDELKEAAARGRYDGITDPDGNAWIEWGDSTKDRSDLSGNFKVTFPDPKTFHYFGGLATTRYDFEHTDHSVPVFYPVRSRDIKESFRRVLIQYNQAVRDYQNFGAGVNRENLVRAFGERDSLVLDLNRVRENLNVKVIPGFRSLLQAWVAESEWFIRQPEASVKKDGDDTRQRLQELWGRARYLWDLINSGVEISVIEESLRYEESRVAAVTPPFLLAPLVHGLKYYGLKRDSILIPAQRINERRTGLEWLTRRALHGEPIEEIEENEDFPGESFTVARRTNNSLKLEKYLNQADPRTRRKLKNRLRLLGTILEKGGAGPTGKFRAGSKRAYYAEIEKREYKESKRHESSDNKQPGNTVGRFVEEQLKKAGLPPPDKIPKDFSTLYEDYRQIPGIEM